MQREKLITLIATVVSFALGLFGAGVSVLIIEIIAAVGHVAFRIEWVIFVAALISGTLTFFRVRRALALRKPRDAILSTGTKLKISLLSIITPIIISILIFPSVLAGVFISEAIKEYRLGNCESYSPEFRLKVECYSRTISSGKLSGKSLSKAYVRRANTYSNQEYNNEYESEKERINLLKNALADYNAALELDPQNPHFYNNRGNVHRKLGNTRLAVTDYKKALEIYPGMYRARDSLESLENLP